MNKILKIELNKKIIALVILFCYILFQLVYSFVTYKPFDESYPKFNSTHFETYSIKKCKSPLSSMNAAGATVYIENCNFIKYFGMNLLNGLIIVIFLLFIALILVILITVSIIRNNKLNKQNEKNI